MLLGAAVSLSVFSSKLRIVVLAALAALVARWIVVFLTSLLFRKTTEAIPTSWPTVLTWGGLRGALCLVLALSLSDTLVNQDLIVAMTAGTVIFSLVGQGLTMDASGHASSARRMAVSRPGEY